MSSVLSISNLGVVTTATGVPLIENVDLAVSEGEFVGLVGESGSGKTTVGLACLGFARRGTRISSGLVRVGERQLLPMSGADLTSLRRDYVAYVPQSAGFSLNPALTIGGQLRDRLFQDGDRADDALLDALEQVSLPRTHEFLRRYPHQLSGGQQQRIVIASALIANPKVVIFDEPTTGLDVATQAQILDTIREICAVHKTAGLFISHDLAAVAGLCSRTAVMKSGRIVEIGPTATILRRPDHPYTRALVSAVPSLHAMPSDGGASDRSAQIREVPALAVRALNAFYDEHHVLHDIDALFEKGECTAVVGESGSGKTTLCRSIIGLHGRYSGRIELGEQLLDPLARRRSAQQRRDLQYVFQNPYDALNPRRSVGELIRQPLRVLGEEIPKNFVRDQLARVSLRPEIADRFPHQLSGGERQRVAFARALGARPRVLICDEVTSALDVSVQASIVDLIAELRRAMKLTVLFVTHNLALVPQMAKNVIVMRNGRIVDAGRTMDVFQNPSSDYTRMLLEKTPDLQRCTDAA